MPGSNHSAEIGILGGSGLYEIPGLEEERDVDLDTPFGAPSSTIRTGRLRGRRVAFIARHGRRHELLPVEVNYRANLYAFKMLGVERVLSASAVGSMRESIEPRDVVLVDQFIDRTHHRPATFFGGGMVAHITFADPVCAVTRSHLLQAARNRTPRIHDGGVYLCIEGPAFSTRAESMLYRRWGVDVIGMTNLHEAKLAREAELCYATMALVTDYDCWHEEEDDVSVAALLENLRANGALAADVLADTVEALPASRDSCGCGEALSQAIITPIEAIPAETLRRLGPIVSKYVPV